MKEIAKILNMSKSDAEELVMRFHGSFCGCDPERGLCSKDYWPEYFLKNLIKDVSAIIKDSEDEGKDPEEEIRNTDWTDTHNYICAKSEEKCDMNEECIDDVKDYAIEICRLLVDD